MNHKKPVPILAVVSRPVGSDQHCPFLDYDRAKLSDVAPILKALSKKHRIGDWFVYKTTRGLHALSPELVSSRTYSRILYESGCDPLMLGYFKHRRYCCLRISTKAGNPTPKPLLHLKTHFGKFRKASEHHLVLLRAQGFHPSYPKDRVQPTKGLEFMGSNTRIW